MLQEFFEQEALTNEEKRVEAYIDWGNPTIPSSVNEFTKLEELNLNWTEKDLPEKERTKHVHRLHPYLGKYIPQLVEIFLRKYFKPGQTVLDPFCGSGTTLVQANELGINSLGFDISAFNVMLCRVKTTTYDLELLRREALTLLGKVKEESAGVSRPKDLFSHLKENSISFSTENEYLKEWFAEQTLKELLIYSHLISDLTYKEVFKIVLSRSARSARLTTHFDLDFPKKPQLEPYHCYKHDRICQPTTEALKFLERYTLDTVKRIEEFSKIRTSAKVEVRHIDSRIAEFDEVDGLITSPPYVGLIDYHDQHKYAYQLLGLDDNSQFEIGPAKSGKSKKAKEEFKTGLVEVFTNAASRIKKGGKMIVVAGDRDNLYPEIAERVGLNLFEKIDRHVNRRTGRRSGEFYETVFIYQIQ
ncbi:MAG: class I SAM-dependent methyltransferase [Saprospiraceae bacterium]|nr:MAG: class I SAM-dependent methyltransferase [Saprospiraceae bacterium]